ncbi:MAG: AI-2E family transporter [Candidatus Woesearchaeota archaeon]
MLFHQGSKFFKILLLFLLGIGAFFVIKPTLDVLLAAILISYIMYPLHSKLIKLKTNPTLSAVFCIFLFIVILLIPSVFLVENLIKQIAQLNVSPSSVIEGLNTICANNDFCYFLFDRNNIVSKTVIDSISSLFIKFFNFITEKVYSFIISLPQILFKFFLTILFVFLFLKNGKIYIEEIEKYIPLKKEELQKFINDADMIMKGVIFGSIFGAMIQGVFGSLIYFLLGLDSFLLLGILTFFTAFVPILGTSLVWLPLSGFLIIKGIILGESILVIKGIILILVAIFFLTTIDDILRPYLVSVETRRNPIIILLGIVGGMSLMGFLGVFFGPMLLELFLLFLKEEKSSL